MAFRFVLLGLTVFVSLTYTATGQVVNLEDNDATVLILGGGVSGIRAAAHLIENGIEDIIILEPTDHLRGVLATVEFDGKKFAPGSLWGFERAKDKLDEKGISYKASNYDSYVFINKDGEDVTEEAEERWEDLDKAVKVLEEVAKDIDAGRRPDVSRKAALARGGWFESSDIDRVLEWNEFDFTEGPAARDTSTIGPWRQSGKEDGVLYGGGEYLITDPNRTVADAFDEWEAFLQEGHVRYEQVGTTS